MLPDSRAHPPSSSHHPHVNEKFKDLSHLRDPSKPIQKKHKFWPRICPTEKVHSCIILLCLFCLRQFTFFCFRIRLYGKYCSITKLGTIPSIQESHFLFDRKTAQSSIFLMISLAFKLSQGV